MRDFKSILEKGILVLLCLVIFCEKKEENNMTTTPEHEIKTFILSNNNNCSVTITNLGATVMSIKMPDKSGTIGDVALAYDNVATFSHSTKTFVKPVEKKNRN